MALTLVTLRWDVTDLIQAGVAAILTIVPSALLLDTADHVTVAAVPRPVTFRGGTGQLAGIVANDSAGIAPAGTGYTITITAATGQLIYSGLVQILTANGATQWLDSLTPVASVSAVQPYLLKSGGTLTGALVPAVVALTDAATIAVNAALGNSFRVTLGGNRTMGAPGSPADGQPIDFELTQDGTGSRMLTWNAAFGFGGGTAPTLSTAAGALDIVGFRYSAAKSKWLFLGSQLGF